MTKYMVTKHQVRDYAQWKKVFDESRSIVEPYGLKNFEVCCDTRDPNTLYIVHEFTDESRVRQLLESPELKQVMERAGVIGPPEVMFMELLASEAQEAQQAQRLKAESDLYSE